MKKKRDMRLNKDKKETLVKSQLNDGVEQFEKEIMNKKKLPLEEENKINKKIFENILIADIIMMFLYFISLGALNIETPIFLSDLKVFSMGLIIFTIILFEISYKTENGNLCIHGIECFILSVFMLFSGYIYTMHIKDFYLYVAIPSYLFAIYYVGKSIILYQKEKKQYVASLSDIEEIIKK